MTRTIRVLAAILLGALLTLPSAALAYTQSTVLSSGVFNEHGRRCAWYRYTESAVTTSSNAIVPIDFTASVLVVLHQDRTSGTATTLHTVIGTEDAFTVGTLAHKITATATADPINEAGEGPMNTPQKTIYVRPAPDAGADNAVTTELLICAGAP